MKIKLRKQLGEKGPKKFATKVGTTTTYLVNDERMNFKIRISEEV